MKKLLNIVKVFLVAVAVFAVAGFVSAQSAHASTWYCSGYNNGTYSGQNCITGTLYSWVYGKGITYGPSTWQFNTWDQLINLDHNTYSGWVECNGSCNGVWVWAVRQEGSYTRWENDVISAGYEYYSPIERY